MLCDGTLNILLFKLFNDGITYSFILVILYYIYFKKVIKIGINSVVSDLKSSYKKWYNHFNLLITPIIITL